MLTVNLFKQTLTTFQVVLHGVALRANLSGGSRTATRVLPSVLGSAACGEAQEKLARYVSASPRGIERNLRSRPAQVVSPKPTIPPTDAVGPVL